MIFGGLYTSHIVSAQENNTEKLNAAEIALNEDFVKQFPYAEQFTDEDGVSARRIKAPDTAVNTKPKGCEKEVTRKVNYKDKKQERHYLEFIRLSDFMEQKNQKILFQKQQRRKRKFHNYLKLEKVLMEEC